MIIRNHKKAIGIGVIVIGLALTLSGCSTSRLMSNWSGDNETYHNAEVNPNGTNEGRYDNMAIHKLIQHRRIKANYVKDREIANDDLTHDGENSNQTSGLKHRIQNDNAKIATLNDKITIDHDNYNAFLNNH